jgi:hypothetical protein
MNRIELHDKWRVLRRLGTTVLILWTVAIALSLKPDPMQVSAHESQAALGDQGLMPDLGGAVGWFNSPLLNAKSLPGNVVAVIGVHTPEFGFEKERPNVENAVRELGISFPVAIDSNHAVWQAFQNEYWPADYLIDGKGRIRYRRFGEGEYDEFEHAESLP